MNKYFKIFWIIYLIEFIAPILLFFFYLTGIDIIFLFKIPQILYLLLIFVFHINKPIKKNPYLLIFFYFGLFELIYGLLMNRNLDGKFFSHIYYNIIPILGTSFGIYFAENYTYNLKSFFYNIINVSFWMTIVILLIYFYLHFVTGQIPYWGFGTEMHMLIPFLLVQKKYILVLLGFIFVIFSGKRATTLNVVLIGIMYFWNQIFTYNWKKSIFWVFLLIIFSYLLKTAFDQGYLSRFEDSLNFDINDDYLMTVATSGRWQEITGIIDFLNENSIRWFVGAGFGGTYLWEVKLSDVYEWKHYAHFSPFSYLFIYGLPITILLYYNLISLVVKGFKYIDNQFFITFIVLVFGSFFGANLLIDFKIWFFIGIAYHLCFSKFKNPLILN